jgi:hypothetical protein
MLAGGRGGRGHGAEKAAHGPLAIYSLYIILYISQQKIVRNKMKIRKSANLSFHYVARKKCTQLQCGNVCTA